MSKSELLAWAYSVLSEHVGNDSYGTITIAMAGGKISGVKSDINHKPPVDGNVKMT